MDDELAPPPVPPREALRYFRAKGFTFGFSWQDVWQAEHARAFTVAKAMGRDLLEDIRAAVDRAIADGETFDDFRKALRPKLEARGWWGRKRMFDPLTGRNESVQLGSPRRLKTIFAVNMRTSYQAGRWERIQRQKKSFPFLRYVSVMDGRERPEHHAWHGTIRPIDDDWWDTHYPPCGWNCRCTAVALNARTMARKGYAVTERPTRFKVKQWTNKRTGEIHLVEQGIDPGWSYNVGKAALDGLVPPPLSSGGGSGPPDDAIAATSLSPASEKALSGFFAKFGLDGPEARERGRVWFDATSWPLAISAALFRDTTVPGADELAIVAAVLTDPDSVALAWIKGRDGRSMLVRRYVRRGNGAGIVDWGGRFWRWHIAEVAREPTGLVVWRREETVLAASRSYIRDRQGRFARTGGAAATFASEVAGGGQPDALELGTAGGEAPEDVRGFARSMPADRARHILATHGVGGQRGDSRPIEPGDFDKIDTIVRSGTQKVHGRSTGGRGQSISYRFEFDGVAHVYVERVGRKRKRLITATYYKED